MTIQFIEHDYEGVEFYKTSVSDEACEAVVRFIKKELPYYEVTSITQSPEFAKGHNVDFVKFLNKRTVPVHLDPEYHAKRWEKARREAESYRAISVATTGTVMFVPEGKAEYIKWALKTDKKFDRENKKIIEIITIIKGERT